MIHSSRAYRPVRTVLSPARDRNLNWSLAEYQDRSSGGLGSAIASQVSAAYERLQVNSREQWRSWLTVHAGSSPGVWLVTWKKGHGPYLPYDDVLDEALCFGWVDSQPRSIDDDRSSRLLTPRRAGSSWSRVNKQRVDRLTAAGLFMPAGLEVVRAAQHDGSWTALDAVES
ncbi:hypothetical protein BH24ACT10_BH24ACT10_17190 [soil metagenome]